MFNIVERARHIRKQIETMAQNLNDETALDYKELFKNWSNSETYELGDKVRYEGNLYRCLNPHTSQETWTPTDAPSLWARVLIENPDVISEWVQPDSTNPYMTGDKVSHNGKTWICYIENNVWEPGIYGWTEMP